MDDSFRTGDLVRVRGARWRVNRVVPHEDCARLDLAGAEASNHQRVQSLLLPFDRPLSIRARSGVRVVRPRQALHGLRTLVDGAPPFGSVHAAAHARVDLLPWQLEPALCLCRGEAARVLVADEVGLGKTVQAGLCIAELMRTGDLEHVLVVTPPGLRDQWSRELADRFSIDTTVIDAATLNAAAATMTVEANPWMAFPVCITSLDFIRQPEVVRGAQGVTWDLLVIDEAHHAATGAGRAAAARALGERARRIVLLTATPHGGDERAFHALCDIGRLDRRDRITLFRRRRDDVGLGSRRRTCVLGVRPTPEEARMHALLRGYTRQCQRERASNAGPAGAAAALAVAVLNKRALSSAASLARSTARRLERLGDRPGDAELQMRLPFSDAGETSSEDEEPLASIVAPALEQAADERRWLERILIAAHRATDAGESKLRALARLIRRARQPAIVYTEYRDTLDQIVFALTSPSALHGGAAALTRDQIVLLHGGLTRDERRDCARAFTSGAATALIATDAAGEGLNLHDRCRLVVNLELPWSPVRLEQRVGRVDRIGQTRAPHAVHLLARGTPEHTVLARLSARSARARDALAPSSEAEDRIARDVLGGRVRPPTAGPIPVENERTIGSAIDQPTTPAPFETCALEHEAASEHRRLVQLRETFTAPLKQGARTTATRRRRRTIDPFDGRLFAASVDRPSCARRRTLDRSGAGIALVVVTSIVDSAGCLVERSVLALGVECDGLSRARRPRDVRRLLEPLAPARQDGAWRLPSPVRDVTMTFVNARLSELREMHARRVGTEQRREVALASWLDRVAGRASIQPALFDRRAERDAERRERIWRDVTLDIHRRIARLESSHALTIGSTHIAIALRLACVSGVETVGRVFRPAISGGPEGPPYPTPNP